LLGRVEVDDALTLRVKTLVVKLAEAQRIGSFIDAVQVKAFPVKRLLLGKSFFSFISKQSSLMACGVQRNRLF
jgi:hypothetical protein